MTLLEKQFIFPRLLSTLFDFCADHGYQVTLGEAYRPKETAALYEKQGKGIRNSLHNSRLAIDLCLFKGGTYLTKGEDYAEVGKFWEGLSSLPEMECAWGGRFNDANHFSISHNGVK